MKSSLFLILSLPTENATLRMRAWRALKTAGAGMLRDGVYILPNQSSCRAVLESVAQDVNGVEGGMAVVLETSSLQIEHFPWLFDRSEQYKAMFDTIEQAQRSLTPATAPDAEKLARKQRKSLQALIAVDYLPQLGVQEQINAALVAWETAIRRLLSPDEPQPASSALHQLQRTKYQNRRWATRQRPWVDRLASAWLIQRFIDPQAEFMWLASPADCPADALGFDFDGATFSHVDQYVTFETLMHSFNLQTPVLQRLAGIVHFLDVGGLEPSEAAGLESVLAGLRAMLADDDALLAAAAAIFDGLLLVLLDNKEPTDA